MPAPKGSGSKFTPDVREMILQRRRLGVPLGECARAAGVSDRTLYTWQTLGQEHQEGGIESDFATFASDLEKAGAEGITALIAKVQRTDDWRAAAWMLARCWPHYFGKQVEEHPPAPTVLHSEQGMVLPPEIAALPAVQEALAAYADTVASAKRDS